MRRHRNFLGPAGMGGMVGLWGASSLIKSIQRGTIAITGATSATATIAAVAMENCRLVRTGRLYSDNTGSGAQSFIRLTFTNATTITATVVTSPSAQTATVGFEVIEYVPGVIKSVQRGTVTFPTTTATITEVNTAKSQIDHLGSTANSGGAIGSVQETNATLTNGTTVTITSGTTGDLQVTGFQVVEWF